MMGKEEDILLKSVLVPKFSGILRELGESRIRQGNALIELSESISTLPAIEAVNAFNLLKEMGII